MIHAKRVASNELGQRPTLEDLINTDGTGRISDFNLAKFLLDDQGLSVGGVLLGAPSSLAFSPDGALLASGSADHTIKRWDVRTEWLLLTLLRDHDAAVTALSFFPEQNLIASVGLDGKVILWKLMRDASWSGELAAEPTVLLGSGEPLHARMTSTDCVLLAAAGSSGTISVWNVGNEAVETTFQGHDGPISVLAIFGQPGGDGVGWKRWNRPSPLQLTGDRLVTPASLTS